MSEATQSSPLWIEWQRAFLEETVANARRMASLPFIWQRAQALKKGISASEVIYEQDRLKVLHYLNAQPPRYSTPLLFVYALVNRPYILDLKAGRSVVSHFVKHGFDTYLVDWGVPTRADRHLTMDDYINGYLPAVVKHLNERTGAPQVSILGYCMGGTMSAMFTALHQPKVKNLILLAAPIDFETEGGLLNLWSRPEFFDVDRFVDAFGNCPPEFLQASFLLLKPVQNLIEKPLALLERADNSEFVDDFLTMEMWLNDNIPVPGEIYREFVKYLYQRNLLVKNRMPVGRSLVDLRRITCPVLNIMAEGDDLVPCSQSRPFQHLVGSKDRQEILCPAGHVGLAIGTKAQREVWPKACQWLAQRSA